MIPFKPGDRVEGKIVFNLFFGGRKEKWEPATVKEGWWRPCTSSS